MPALYNAVGDSVGFQHYFLRSRDKFVPSLEQWQVSLVLPEAFGLPRLKLPPQFIEVEPQLMDRPADDEELIRAVCVLHKRYSVLPADSFVQLVAPAPSGTSMQFSLARETPAEDQLVNALNELLHDAQQAQQVRELIEEMQAHSQFSHNWSTVTEFLPRLLAVVGADAVSLYGLLRKVQLPICVECILTVLVWAVCSES